MEAECLLPLWWVDDVVVKLTKHQASASKEPNCSPSDKLALTQDKTISESLELLSEVCYFCKSIDEFKSALKRQVSRIL